MSGSVPRQLGAKVFIAAMALAALACFWIAFADWHSTDPIKFLCYVTVAFLASFLKIKLPGINGTMSVNFLFILLGVLEMSFGETVVIGFAAVLALGSTRPAIAGRDGHRDFQGAGFAGSG